MRYPTETLLAAAMGLATTGGLLSGCARPFDRPMIYSINPEGNGDFVGAPHTGPDFVRWDHLLFEKVSEAGSRSARILASWREIEAEPGEWDWSDLDRQMELCERFDIEPVVLIVNIPGWVSPTGEPTHKHPPREENAEDFNRFITKLAERYKGRVRYYEFWNEQNGWGWHVERRDGRLLYNRADEYIPWLYRCYQAIKAVDPDAQVSMGGLDDTEGHGHVFVRLSYEMRRDEYDDERFWDAIADHPYNKRKAETAEDAIAKIDAIRAVAAEFGDADIPIWITEYGWHAGEMGLDVQARGTREFLERFARPDQHDLPIAQQLCIADIEQVHRGYGVCNLNLRPHGAFYEFQRLARPDVPQVSRFRYRIEPGGTVIIEGELSRRLPLATRAHLDVIDEHDEVLAEASWSYRSSFHQRFRDLPADTPLLARLTYTVAGRRQHPIARLPLIRPAEGAVLANGDFRHYFRAGVPWGWRPAGEAICHEGSVLGEGYARSADQSLMLIVFNNHPEYRFADRVEIPVAAARGDRFVARLAARYNTRIHEDPGISISMRLADPDAPPADAAIGTHIGEEWTPVAVPLEAPCDAPVLVIGVRSDTLPEGTGRQRWLVILDDVTLTPASVP